MKITKHKIKEANSEITLKNLLMSNQMYNATTPRYAPTQMVYIENGTPKYFTSGDIKTARYKEGKIIYTLNDGSEIEVWVSTNTNDVTPVNNGNTGTVTATTDYPHIWYDEAATMTGMQIYDLLKLTRQAEELSDDIDDYEDIPEMIELYIEILEDELSERIEETYFCPHCMGIIKPYKMER